MPVPSRLVSSLAGLLLGALAAGPAQAYQISVGVPTPVLAGHVDVDIGLAWSAGEALSGVQFDLAYDHALLDFAEALAGPLTNGWIFATSAPGDPGPVTVVAATAPEVAGPVSGRLATLRFAVLGAGSAGLALSGIELSNDAGVVPAEQISVVPEPSPSALLAGGLVALALLGRAKRGRRPPGR